MICGGTTPEAQDATPEVQELCDKVRSEAAVKAGINGEFKEFVALQHKTQVVAGMNFFVKVHAGEGRHIHLRIYRDLQGNVSLNNLQADKTREDTLEYF